ncbi:MAG: hypothetical protein CL661_04125 [Bacteroidetes bacterium]|mgnify:CR=1 FL=1|nr:hypothetical protein [Bacteroidota bacterium]|tara:strand:- start:580 stop:1410 length:831 start_codon:yes stop_codon:yes gene_type:complete
MKADLKLTKKNFWIIASNSTASYVLAFLLIFYLNHVVKIILAGSYGYDLGFDWYNISYYIKPYEWTHDSVKLIYSSGPILIFIIGLISLIAFWSLVEEPARIKIFFMWLTLHAFNFFFGGLLIGNLFKKGVGHVFNWMYLTDTTKMIVALLGFLGLLGTAYIMSKPAAITANSYLNKLDERNFPFFVSSQLIVPFVFGTLFYLSFFLPRILFQEAYSWISLVLILIFIMGRISRMDTIYFDEEDRSTNLSLVIILVTVIIFVVLRVLLHNEIYISG